MPGSPRAISIARKLTGPKAHALVEETARRADWNRKKKQYFARRAFCYLLVTRGEAMLENMVTFFRRLGEADVAEDLSGEPREGAAFDGLAEASPAEPNSELLSLLDAVREQCVAMHIEQARAASESRRELETLTARMTTLVPRFIAAVEAQTANELHVGRLSRTEIDLARQLDDAQAQLDHYRPLAASLEDALLTEQNRSAQGARDLAALELNYTKAERRLADLLDKLTIAETELQRVTEVSTAYATKAHEHDFAMEAALREIAQLQSELVARTSDVERQVSEIASLAVKLAHERDGSVRAQAALTSLQAEYDRFRKASDLAVKDFEVRDRRLNEIIAQRDWQIFDYETRYAALESRIEFLAKKNEVQRDDILRHITHIGKLESSNRYLLDTLSRSAIIVDDASPEAERGGGSPPKLRAIPDE